MLVSGGYPGDYEKGKVIDLEKINDSIIFHAGTKIFGESIVTNGGRVLSVSSYGQDFREALKVSYNNIEKIRFEGRYYRPDIGFDLG